MKLLIDIPDWLYQHIVDFGVLESDEPELYWAIYKGQKINMKNLVEENKEDYKMTKEEAKTELIHLKRLLDPAVTNCAITMGINALEGINSLTAYNEGLRDAWEAAKKLYQYDPTNNKQLCEELFDCNFNETICTTSPSKAIAKIKDYESREIKVGDEVRSVSLGNIGVIVKINAFNSVYIIWKDGSCGRSDKECLIRTGRNFPQITQVLNLMKGGLE